MEEFYGQNVCFVTGATGFVGKVLVEKLLRWQPHGPPLYLLIRPRQDESAQDRLHREVLCHNRCIFVVGVKMVNRH